LAALVAAWPDMICANLINKEDTGFKSDENEITIITKSKKEALKKNRKSILAREIISRIP
jgi:phosphopantothenoylcysteine synthetase/decarboxylase